MTIKKNVLSTKLLDERLISKAAENAIIIEAVPFLDFVYTPSGVLAKTINGFKKESFIIFTSANAIKAVSQVESVDYSAWNIFCLEGATLNAVNKYLKNASVIDTADNAMVLALKIANHGIKHLTFFCSFIHLDLLPDMLSGIGVQVDVIHAYETVLIPKTVENKYSGVIFYSPSGVKSYFSANTANTPETFFAIGETTAKALEVYNKKLIISSKPTPESMVDLVINYYNTNNGK